MTYADIWWHVIRYDDLTFLASMTKLLWPFSLKAGSLPNMLISASKGTGTTNQSKRCTKPRGCSGTKFPGGWLRGKKLSNMPFMLLHEMRQHLTFLASMTKLLWPFSLKAGSLPNMLISASKGTGTTNQSKRCTKPRGCSGTKFPVLGSCAASTVAHLMQIKLKNSLACITQLLNQNPRFWG